MSNIKFSNFDGVTPPALTSYVVGYDGNYNTRYTLNQIFSLFGIVNYVKGLHRNTASQSITANTATEFTNATHTLATSSLRVGSLIVCQGFVSSTTTAVRGVQLSSNSTVPTVITTSSQNSAFIFYARYIGGANGTLRFYRGGAFGGPGTVAVADVNAVSGNHTFKLYGQSASGTLTLEHVSYTLIY